MRRSTCWPSGRCFGTVFRTFLPHVGTGGCGLLPTGCAVLGGAAAAAGAALLTGLFLGSIQATFAATARSYAFTDVGSVQLVFESPHRRTTDLVRFSGRLPGFHFVIITDRSKVIRTAQTEEVVFETDVEIDFEASPPTITGTVRQRGGPQEFTLDELYPDITLTQEVSGADDSGRREVTLTIVGRGPGGEELEYTLVLQTRLTTGGDFLAGPVEVTRNFTAPGVEPLVIEGSGELDARKQDEPADDEQDLEPENGNLEDETDENADEGEVEDEGNDIIDDDGDGVDDGDDDSAPVDTTPPSACLPGLPELLAQAVDMFVEAGGQDALDLNGDGTVTSTEVQEAVNPLIGPFFSVSPQAAACIAELLN